MDEMSITSAQYVAGFEGNNISIKAVIDGVEYCVPLDAPGNKEYDAIMAAVAAGDLTIADAD
tara:strand:- start:10 stop:195 length:186 start_codon:yes stop_codon:yes gene_type:complete